MTIAVVRAHEGLAAEWERLFRRCPQATPFQSPLWLGRWWRHFGSGAPVIATLRRDGDLRGVLALYVLDGRLLPIGAGVTDYQDVLLEAPDADDASELMAAALGAPGLPCDLIDLPPESLLRQVRAPPGWVIAREEADPCPTLTLDPNDPLAAVPSGKRRDVRQFRNRADRVGGWSVAIDRSDAALSALLLWHRTRHPDADARLRAFLADAAAALLLRGDARIYLLRIAGQPAAAYFVLLAPGRLLFYLGAFDPAFSALSPSTILMAEIIAMAAMEGRTELHFLRGDEPYKYAWGAKDRRNMQILLRPQ